MITKNFNDAVIYKDFNNNQKLERQNNMNNKIDGIVAAIHSLAAWILDDRRPRILPEILQQKKLTKK
jgi:phage terminase large subunit-like protein